MTGFKSFRVNVTLPGCPDVPMGGTIWPLSSSDRALASLDVTSNVSCASNCFTSSGWTTPSKTTLPSAITFHVGWLPGMHLEREDSEHRDRPQRKPLETPWSGAADCPGDNTGTSAGTGRQETRVKPRAKSGAVAMVPGDPSNNDQSDRDNRSRRRTPISRHLADTLGDDVDVHIARGPQSIFGHQTILIETQETRDRTNEPAIENSSGKLIPLIFFNCLEKTRADARGG